MIGRLGVRLGAGLVLLVLVGGVPAMLATLVGWPLPTYLPSWDEVTVVLTSPPTERLLMNTLAVAAWAVWAAFVSSLASEVVALARHGLADRHTQPVGRNPARVLALLLVTAFATGSVAHSAAASATYGQPPAAVELVAVDRPDVGDGAGAASVAAESDPSPQSSPSRGYLWEDPPPVPGVQEGAGAITVDIAGQHHQVPVAAEATYWDLADQLLGDPRRWPEIRDLNPHPNGEVLVLPHDATSPATPTTDQTGSGYDDQDNLADPADPGPPLTYEVRSGDWMWHIAGRFLDDEQRYPEIAALNPELAAQYPDFPDHIQPGDQLLLPADADDQGERRHATGQVDREPPVDPPAPPAPPAPAPETEATDPVPSPPADADPAQPPPSATASPIPPEPPPSAAQPAPTPAGEQTDPPPAEPAEPDDQPGVVLPTGSWVSFGLAALVAALAVMLRLNQRRRARLRFPIPTATGPADSPVPDSLRLAENAGRTQPAPDPDSDEDFPDQMLDPPAIPAPVGVDQRGDPLGLFGLPGEVIALHGPGALPAARAALAAACATGIAEHPLARPQVLTTTGVLARLLPPHRQVDGLDPDGLTFDGEHLHALAGPADAIERTEQEVLNRWRHLEATDADDLAVWNARDDHAEQLPPMLLLIEDAGRHRPRLKALSACRDSLDIHVMVLDGDGSPGIHVDTDGTVHGEADQPDETARIGRLSTLTADELADVIDLVRHAQPRPEPEPDPQPAAPAAASATASALPAVEIPRPSGEDESPVRLQVLGPVTLATASGPVASGVRARAYAALALMASHPAGRTLDQLADDLRSANGPADMRAALRADINSVRATLRKATGISGKFVRHDTATGRYRIDPDLIDVDLWRMLSAIEAANQATDDDTACLAALQEAADCYQGEFGTGLDEPVFLDHATTYRHQILSVYGKIAEILELDNPDQAVAVLEKAAALDPVNEELHQRIMRIHGRAGRPDEVRRTLSRLEARLAEIGQAEPSAATRRVAQRQLATTPADNGTINAPVPSPVGGSPV